MYQTKVMFCTFITVFIPVQIENQNEPMIQCLFCLIRTASHNSCVLQSDGVVRLILIVLIPLLAAFSVQYFN